ncbi:hypothetical protein F5Y16DRAFT_237599 [Xylariaceae sp. FL0255]|nr:hypothetical protein F5Y16DRAFT_237599 [Xylariaceae sp. FL0255]
MDSAPTSATVRSRKQLPSERARQKSTHSALFAKVDPTSTLRILAYFENEDSAVLKLPESAQGWRNIFEHFKPKASNHKRKRPWNILPTHVGDIILEHVLDTHQLEFLQRSKVGVYVCDFYEDKALLTKQSMQNFVELSMEKPDEVALRWIHVPIGKGLFQSTLEDIFLHCDDEDGRRPNTFVQSGLPEWPYPEMSMLTFINREDHIARMEALEKLQTLPRFSNIDAKANLCAVTQADLEWREGIMNKKLDFWETVQADFPATAAERICLRQDIGPLSGSSTSKDFKKQVLSHHKQFANASLVMNTLRGFNRSDGFLLTFANTSGIDYLTREFESLIEHPGYDFLYHPGASVLAHTMQAFRCSGIRRWKRKCNRSAAAWLMMYLFTEAAVTPHNIRGGRTAMEPLDAYLRVMQSLEKKKDEPWVYGQSPIVVREYQDYMAEIKAIESITSDNVRLLKSMLQDITAMEDSCNHLQCIRDRAAEEPDDEEDNSRWAPETMTQRLNWAIKLLEERSHDLARMETHFEKALKNLMEVCTVEQNDRSVVADTMNKAILVFTAITVVFLPLSFITSYLGMNLVDVRNTNLNQTEFWKWIGAAAFAISISALLYTWRRKLRDVTVESVNRAKKHE